MTASRQTIGGTLDYRLLASLNRPNDPDVLRQEAVRLMADGMTIRDVADAMRLSPAAVNGMLGRGKRPETRVERLEK